MIEPLGAFVDLHITLADKLVPTFGHIFGQRTFDTFPQRQAWKGFSLWPGKSVVTRT